MIKMVPGLNSSEVDSESDSSEDSKVDIQSPRSRSPPQVSTPTSVPQCTENDAGPLVLRPRPSQHMDSFEFRYSLPIVLPRRVPCVVLSPNNEPSTSPGIPMFQVPVIDSPLDSIMAKISKLSSTESPFTFSANGNFTWKQSESYHEDNLRESMELYNSMKEIVKDSERTENEQISAQKAPSDSEDRNFTVKTSTNSGQLSFGIDRILHSKPADNVGKDEAVNKPVSTQFPRTHSDFHQPKYLNHCSDCYLLSRFCYKYSPPRSPAPGSTPCQSNSNCSATIWNAIPHNIYDHTSTFIQSSGFRSAQIGSFPSSNPSTFHGISSIVSCNNNTNGRRKRSWSRAVFSNLQRKGLEKRFQIQKYITKPDRRQLAATLGLTDAQVKVWFQNRRMKWRHSKEGKSGDVIGTDILTPSTNSTITPATRIENH